MGKGTKELSYVRMGKVARKKKGGKLERTKQTSVPAHPPKKYPRSIKKKLANEELDGLLLHEPLARLPAARGSGKEDALQRLAAGCRS